MKKIVFLIILVLVFFTGCSKETNEKIFTGSGVTITLNDTFIEEESKYFNLYLRTDEIEIGAVFSYTDEGTTLRGFAENFFEENTKIYRYKDSITTFDYVFYESIINDVKYSYMAASFKGEEEFYVVSFICKTLNYNKYKDDFMMWAKTIRVA